MRLTLTAALGLLSFRLGACATLVDTLAAGAQAEGLTTIFNLTARYPDLVSALNDTSACFTVFLPTDAALASVDLAPFSDAQVKDVIRYHVVPCGNGTALDAPDFGPLSVLDSALTGPSDFVKFRGAQKLVAEGKHGAVAINAGRPFPAVNVVKTIRASNGIAHAVDGLLVPPPSVPVALNTTATGNFSTLLSLVARLGLAETIVNATDITIFAPTNEAFAKLGNVSLSDDALRTVLKYHVVPGARLYSKDVLAAKTASLQTAASQSLRVAVVGGAVKVGDNNATVTFTDILANNGVVHAIDSVLLPPNKQQSSDKSKTGDQRSAAAGTGGLAAALGAAMTVALAVLA